MPPPPHRSGNSPPQGLFSACATNLQVPSDPPDFGCFLFFLAASAPSWELSQLQLPAVFSPLPPKMLGVGLVLPPLYEARPTPPLTWVLTAFTAWRGSHGRPSARGICGSKWGAAGQHGSTRWPHLCVPPPLPTSTLPPAEASSLPSPGSPAVTASPSFTSSHLLPFPTLAPQAPHCLTLASRESHRSHLSPKSSPIHQGDYRSSLGEALADPQESV